MTPLGLHDRQVWASALTSLGKPKEDGTPT